VFQYRPKNSRATEARSVPIDYASRQTSFKLSTNPLKAKWVRSSQVGGAIT